MANTNIKKAQNIINQVDKELGISLVAYEISELELLKNKIEALLDLHVDMDELHDADDDDLLDDEELSDDETLDDDEEEDLQF
jgi:hypothetical protein